MKPRNNFGVLSTEYHTARRGYPPELFEYLKSLVKTEGKKVLDVGCGTGIATRQLKEVGFDVNGSDKDETMVKVALENSPDISYIVAPADKLPFESETFDVVTIFTAFHWFAHEKAVEEMKRVLKPGGVLFAALKDNRTNPKTAHIRKEYRAILHKYVGDRYNSANKYNPGPLLKKCNLKNIEEKSFPIDELYTVEEALTLIKSLSFWNLVPDEKKPEMLGELKAHYEKYLVDGMVVREREVSTIAGYK